MSVRSTALAQTPRVEKGSSRLNSVLRAGIPRPLLLPASMPTAAFAGEESEARTIKALREELREAVARLEMGYRSALEPEFGVAGLFGKVLMAEARLKEAIAAVSFGSTSIRFRSSSSIVIEAWIRSLISSSPSTFASVFK